MKYFKTFKFIRKQLLDSDQDIYDDLDTTYLCILNKSLPKSHQLGKGMKYETKIIFELY